MTEGGTTRNPSGCALARVGANAPGGEAFLVGRRVAPIVLIGPVHVVADSDPSRGQFRVLIGHNLKMFSIPSKPFRTTADLKIQVSSFQWPTIRSKQKRMWE